MPLALFLFCQKSIFVFAKSVWFSKTQNCGVAYNRDVENCVCRFKNPCSAPVPARAAHQQTAVESYLLRPTTHNNLALQQPWHRTCSIWAFWRLPGCLFFAESINCNQPGLAEWSPGCCLFFCWSANAVKDWLFYPCVFALLVCFARTYV